jgi:asparagine synthase (glutamine-hydrolysing)
MIISGIINNFEEDILNKLLLFTRYKIKKNETIFSNKNTTVIAGNTSENIYQGEILKFKDGILIGKVFSKKDYQQIKINDIPNLGDKTESFLIENCWGNYIFVRTDITSNLVYILRDPIGQFNLFYTKLNSSQTIIFSSSIQVLHDAIGKTSPEYNMAYFAAYMLNTYISTESTAFKNITELLAGNVLKVDTAKNSITYYSLWNPLDYYKSQIKNFNIEEQIIFTLENVVKSWIKNSKGVFLDFSGGTDSTSLLLIANKILEENQFLKAINIFHPLVSASDERVHANSIAKSTCTTIVEFDRSNSLAFDDLLSNTPKLDLPSPILIVNKFQRDISKISNEYENITHMSGHGGDHIFLCPTPLSSICDYFLEKGLAGIYSKIKEISFMFRLPLVQVSRNFIGDLSSYYFLSNKQRIIEPTIEFNPLKLDNDFLRLEKTIKYNQIPIDKVKKKILPGKLSHINSIIRGLATVKKDIRNDRTNPVFYPLFSQPMIELAISIASYDSFKDGFNRYPFRKSISDEFNTNYVWRKDKGDTSGSLQLGLKKNQNSIKDLCLNGKLINMGILKEDGFLNCFKMALNGQNDVHWALINLVSLELFFKSWS